MAVIKRTKIGIIGGLGWMGREMAKAFLSSGALLSTELIISSRSFSVNPLADWPALTLTSDNQWLADQCDTVFISVRPQQFKTLSIDLSHARVISIMAGISVETIASHVGASRVIRAMPNAAVEFRQSYTPWYAGPGVDTSEYPFIQKLFEIFGQADRVETENDMDYFTALTGSGPGIVSFYAKTMIDSAIADGINAQLAERAIRQLFCGAGMLIAHDAKSPEEQFQLQKTYNGTTAAAMRSLNASPLGQVIHAAIQAAYQKAKSIE